MELKPVKSSNISGIGYDAASKVLHVQFNDGARYSYSKVPADAHKAFVQAQSISQHFHNEIKNVYTATKVKKL